MRRSQSSSNIPLFTSLQTRRDSRSRERAKSAARGSRERSLEGITPLARHRLALPSGSDRKYSAQKNLLRTPTTPSNFLSSGFKRSSSLTSFGSRSSVTSRFTKSPAEKKTLAKQQYAKVQQFILTSGLFNPELADKIRPPTMATFVELVSVLFRQMTKTIPINLQNYGEVVLNTLKLFRYPAQITSSALKTVNTMHGWPTFLQIISWLIDRVDLINSQNTFMEQQDEDQKAAFNMYNSVFDFLGPYYAVVSNNTTPDEQFLAEQENQLLEDMLRITGTDEENAARIKDRLETERAQATSLKNELQEIQEENAKIQRQNLEKQTVINKFEESKCKREQELKEQLVRSKEALSKSMETKSALATAVAELEKCIAMQPYKYKEKTKILSQIDELRRVIERKERKLAEYRVVRDDLDLELKTLVTETERKVDAWNVFITKTFLPELKKLRLREKGFHSEDFRQEIVDIKKEIVELQEKLLKEGKTLQIAIEALRKQKQSLIERNKAAESTAAKFDDLRGSIQILEEQNKTLVLSLDDCKRNHDREIKEMEQSEHRKAQELKTMVTEFSDRKEKLTNELDKKAQKALSVIIEAYNMTIQNFQKIELCMQAKVSHGNVYLSECIQNLQSSFEHFVKLEDINAKLYQTRDGENHDENKPDGENKENKPDGENKENILDGENKPDGENNKNKPDEENKENKPIG